MSLGGGFATVEEAALAEFSGDGRIITIEIEGERAVSLGLGEIDGMSGLALCIHAREGGRWNVLACDYDAENSSIWVEHPTDPDSDQQLGVGAAVFRCSGTRDRVLVRNHDCQWDVPVVGGQWALMIGWDVAADDWDPVPPSDLPQGRK